MGGGHSRRENTFCRGRFVSGQGVFREQGLSWEGLVREGTAPRLSCMLYLQMPGITIGIWGVDRGHEHLTVRIGWVRLQKHTTLRGLQQKFICSSFRVHSGPGGSPGLVSSLWWLCESALYPAFLSLSTVDGLGQVILCLRGLSCAL